MRFRTLEFSEPFLLQLQRQFQSFDDIERFEQFDLLVDIQSGE